jgi:DNA-binding IclR family transcriptional regulator
MYHSTNRASPLCSVIGVFTEQRPVWTADEIVEALGLGRTSIGRCLKTLREAGFVTLYPSGRYSVGPRVVEMEYLLRQSDPLVPLADGDLQQLVAERACIAHVARWYGDRILSLAFRQSLPDVVSPYTQGRPMPLTRGSAGRAILAWLPRRDLGGRIESNLADFAAIGLGGSAGEVLAALNSVRRAGFAVGIDELKSGITSVSAPIFDGGSTPVAVLSVATPTADDGDGHLGELGRDLSRRATDISAQLNEIRLAAS